jgi:hypothetical protein
LLQFLYFSSIWAEPSEMFKPGILRML